MEIEMEVEMETEMDLQADLKTLTFTLDELRDAYRSGATVADVLAAAWRWRRTTPFGFIH